VIKPVDVDQFFEAVRTVGQFWAVLNQAPDHI
jgi:two-component system response regulator